MKGRIVTFAIAFTLLFAYASPAQTQEFAFNRVPLFEKNVRGFITSSAQDSNGYMWFTGVNLYRYDGYHVITYKNDPQNPNTISPSRLESFLRNAITVVFNA